MSNFIEAIDIVKRYDAHVALNGVSLAVPQGCTYGLLGPNGAGKTTLLRIINQIIPQDSGTLLLNGNPMHESSVKHIGYLPEERGLYKKMRVADHIVFLARLKGMPRNEAHSECRRWLQRMNLADWAGKRIETLSKGMQQKVQFIATVIHRPQLLIFDEPFSGFDPVNAQILKDEIMELRNQGATIIFSTHNMESVEALCEQITLINNAHVVLQGSVNDIKQAHKKHIYNVTTTDPTISHNDSLYTVITSANGQSTIRVNAARDIHDVIAWLNDHHTLTGFHEVLPTMNEIFIETVNNSNHAQA